MHSRVSYAQNMNAFLHKLLVTSNLITADMFWLLPQNIRDITATYCIHLKNCIEKSCQLFVTMQYTGCSYVGFIMVVNMEML